MEQKELDKKQLDEALAKQDEVHNITKLLIKK